jgi:hypothetical protein
MPVEAERFDLGQHALQGGPGQSGVHGARAMPAGAIAGNADSKVVSRSPLVQITYRPGAGSISPWSLPGR